MQKFLFLFLAFSIKNMIISQSAISADKMNVLYIGIENPLEIAAANVPFSELVVNITGGNSTLYVDSLSKKYSVFVKSPGEALVILEHKGKLLATHKFRCKRIPDPYVEIPLQGNGKRGGAIPAATFRTLTSLTIVLENFDFDLGCGLQSFEVTRICKNGDPYVLTNQGLQFSYKVLDLIKTAQIGDTFYFDNIKGRCPGDLTGRELNSLIFSLK